MTKEQYKKQYVSYENLINDMQYALENCVGWSMIRISDGEGQLLKSVRLQQEFGCVARKDWRHKFLPVKDWMTIGRELIQAVKSADFIGLPRWCEMSRYTNYALDHELLKHGVDINNLRLTDSWAGHALRYKKNIMLFLCKQYKIGVVYHDLDKANSIFLNQYKTKDLVVFKYNGSTTNEQIISDIIKSQRQLVFISGGPRGKCLGILIKEHGIVAYDIGQSIELSDDWLKNKFEKLSTWNQAEIL